MLLTRRLVIVLSLLITPIVAHSQINKLSGRVVDASTGESLAFVHLLVNNSRSGTTTDIDGRFTINTRQRIETLRLSYVGYEALTINIRSHLNLYPEQTQEDLIIYLKASTRVLSELVFEAGENPAHPIIRKAVENRKINNPEKIKSFKYTSYNKFLVDAENIEDDEDDNDADSTGSESFAQFLETKYLFLMESVTERKYIRPDRSKETVIANRVSGLKNPLFTTLANSFQPFSFYGNYITVAGRNYLNPISKGSTKKYFFSLEDSIYSGENKVYLISFEPRKRNFDGLKGILYINTHKYAIENVIAETANLISHLSENAEVTITDSGATDSSGGALSIQNSGEMVESDTTDLPPEKSESSDDFEEISVTFKIQQKYELLEGEFWFPSQLNTDIVMSDATGESDAALKGIGRSYLSDIELLPELKRREFDRLAVEFDPKANKRDTSFWNQYRVEPITERGLNTYVYIDSIGEEAKLDRFVTGFAMLTTGKIRMGNFQADINRFLGFNQYESLRLGAGLHTSSNLSTFFQVGGYGAYGFKDRDFKYGADAKIFLTKKNEITLFGLYERDVMESGGTGFYLDNNPLSTESNRKFMIENMDKYENIEGGISFYFLKYMDVSLSYSDIVKEATTDYNYSVPASDPAILQNRFRFSEMKLGLKYSFREKYVEVFGNKVSTGTKYPVVWFNYTRGFDDIGRGQFDYEKFDVKIQKTFLIKGFGKPSFTIKGGLARGAVPATNLYNGNGSKVWIIPLEAANSFQTMEMNEFLSDRYVAVYYNHLLGKLRLSRKSNPEFNLVTNIGWGELRSENQHLNYPFKTMERGYYESGLSIRNLYLIGGFFGLGVGGFYRYGEYSRGKEIDNLMVKLTLKANI